MTSVQEWVFVVLWSPEEEKWVASLDIHGSVIHADANSPSAAVEKCESEAYKLLEAVYGFVAA